MHRIPARVPIREEPGGRPRAVYRVHGSVNDHGVVRDCMYARRREMPMAQEETDNS
jgi:hypothetical protein